jgi:hypothetical protein
MAMSDRLILGIGITGAAIGLIGLLIDLAVLAALLTGNG